MEGMKDSKSLGYILGHALMLVSREVFNQLT